MICTGDIRHLVTHKVNPILSFVLVVHSIRIKGSDPAMLIKVYIAGSEIYIWMECTHSFIFQRVMFTSGAGNDYNT